MQRDNQIFELINREHLRQRCGVELIANEVFAGDQFYTATLTKMFAVDKFENLIVSLHFFLK